MNIAHRKFTDGFSWVTSAFKISLSNFLSYGLYCIIFLVIDNGTPKTLSLKEIISKYNQLAKSACSIG